MLKTIDDVFAHHNFLRTPRIGDYLQCAASSGVFLYEGRNPIHLKPCAKLNVSDRIGPVASVQLMTYQGQRRGDGTDDCVMIQAPIWFMGNRD